MGVNDMDIVEFVEKGCSRDSRYENTRFDNGIPRH